MLKKILFAILIIVCIGILLYQSSVNKSYFEKGNALLENKRYGSAIIQYNMAIELNPDNPEYYYNRGVARSGKKNYIKAIKDFNEAIELDPTSPSAYLPRGLGKAELGDYQGAIADLKKVIELDPNETDRMNKLIEKIKQKQSETMNTPGQNTNPTPKTD